MPGFTARIEDASHVAEARRNVRRLANGLSFDEETAEKAAIVVTEVCTNLLKHANGGQIAVQPGPGPETAPDWQGHSESPLLEILALDRGPGIANLEECLRDGHSTTGTAGSGLGAIYRLSSYVEVYSRPGRGTALLARIRCDHGTLLPPGASGAVSVPKPGEDVCGDQWGMTRSNGHRTYMLADGLGHGTDAARAANTAMDVLYRCPHLAVPEMLAAVHDALRPTRGAAVSIAQVHPERRIVIFGGLGNVSGVICGQGAPARRMVSINGTAGVEARHIREFTYPWNDGDLLVMHSDGIGTHWNLEDYPGLFGHDPAIVSGVLYRDYARGNDDATVLAAR